MKASIRQTIKERRAALDPEWADQASAAVCRRISSLDVFARAETVGVYLALPGEVCLSELVAECRRQGKRVCVPVFDELAKVCVMAEWPAEAALVSGKWGVLEPAECRAIDAALIDLMLVPGVAFDPQGERLGRGGGYYDRMLAGSTAQHVGVAFDFQLVAELAPEPHDVPMNGVVSETHFYGRGGSLA